MKKKRVYRGKGKKPVIAKAQALPTSKYKNLVNPITCHQRICQDGFEPSSTDIGGKR